MEIVTGLTGAGKTEYVYEKIKKDLCRGENVLLIVPDREAVEAETALVAYLKDTPCQRLDVYSFSRMCNDFFRKYGGVCYNYIDKTASNLIMFLTLCNVASSLSEYKNVKISDRDIITSLNSAIKQLKSASVTPSLLEQTLDEMEEDGITDKKTLSHLHDILTVYSAREVFLDRGYDDPDDDIAHMLAMLPTHPYFEGKCVYIDSFDGFTPIQYRVMEHMRKQSDSMTVTLLLPDVITSGCADGVFAPSYSVYTELCRMDKKYGEQTVTVPMQSHRRTDDLEALSSCFTAPTVYEKDTENIKLYAFSGIYDEVDAVCADIAKKIRQGARFRDFSIILPDPSVYSGILDEALDACGIRSYISDKGKLSEKPFVKFVFSALDVCNSCFAASDVLAYVKTGLHGVDDESVFEFENYVKTWHIKGKYFYEDVWTASPSGYKAPSESDEELLARLNCAKDTLITPLYDLYRKIHDGEKKTDDYIKALYEFFVQTDVSNTLSVLNQKAVMYMGEQEGMEQEQVWDLFFRSLTTMGKICGDTPLTCRMFSNLLSLVIDCVDIGTIPTSADSVIIGDISNLHGVGGEYVYILGAIEGKLPAATPDSAFTQTDMTALDDYGLQVGTREEIYAQNSLYSFYKACCMAKKGVWISYYTSNVKGEKCDMSEYLDCITSAFPKLDKNKFKVPSGTDLLYSKQKCIRYYAENKGTAQGDSVGEVLDGCDGMFSSMPLSNTTDELSKDVASKFYSGDLVMSNSKIKSFKDCKFAYYCKYGLRLEKQATSQLGNNDLGTFVHYVLQRLLEDYIEDREGRISPYTHKQLCVRYMDEYLKEQMHIQQSINSKGRLGALLRRVSRNLIPVIGYVLDELDAGDFKPWKTELVIGDRSEVPPVKIRLDDGTHISLIGKVDRIDTYEKDGATYVKITDYKTGENNFKTSDLKECEGIQIFMYMISVCASTGLQYRPAAMFYMSAAVKESEVSATDNGEGYAIDKKGAMLNDESIEFALSHDKGKFLNKIEVKTDEEFEELFAQLKEEFAALGNEMKSGVAHAVPKTTGDRSACTYCPYKFLCRKRK